MPQRLRNTATATPRSATDSTFPAMLHARDHPVFLAGASSDADATSATLPATFFTPLRIPMRTPPPLCFFPAGFGLRVMGETYHFFGGGSRPRRSPLGAGKTYTAPGFQTVGGAELEVAARTRPVIVDRAGVAPPRLVDGEGGAAIAVAPDLEV